MKIDAELRGKVEAKILEANVALAGVATSIQEIINLVNASDTMPGDGSGGGDPSPSVWSLVPATLDWMHINWPNVIGPRFGWRDFVRWSDFCEDYGFGQVWNNMYGPRKGDHHDQLLASDHLDAALSALNGTEIPVCLYLGVLGKMPDGTTRYMFSVDRAKDLWLPFADKVREATAGAVEVSIDLAARHLEDAAKVSEMFLQEGIRTRVEASVRRNGEIDQSVPQDMLIQHLKNFITAGSISGKVLQLPVLDTPGSACLWLNNDTWDLLSDVEQRNIVRDLRDKRWGRILNPGDAVKFVNILEEAE